MDTDTTDRDAVWVDRVIGISSEVENCDGENLGTEHEKEVEALEAGSEVEGTVDSPFQRSNEEDDAVEEPTRPAATFQPKKKRKHPPMFAAEQQFMIAALGEKLLEFPAHQPPPSGNVSPEKKAAKKSPPKVAVVTPSDSSEVSPAPKKKRKHPKPKTPPPKQPRPQKRPKKEMIAELKLPRITSTAQILIELLVKFNSHPTPKDVQKIVDVAAEILDNHPNGGSFDEEIKALLGQENEWKQRVVQSDTSLKEDMKKFFERYGMIPMGALEAAEDKAMGT